MQKVILGILGALVVVVGGFVGYVSMQPDTTELERSIVVQASPADVFPHLADYKNFVIEPAGAKT